MSTTHPFEIRHFESIADLPAKYGCLIDRNRGDTYFTSGSWFRLLAETTLSDDQAVRIYGVEESGANATPHALLAMRTGPAEMLPKGLRAISSLSNIYSMQFAPVLSDGGLQAPEAVLGHLMATLRDERPRWDAIVLTPIRRDAPVFDHVKNALSQAGFVVEEYFQYGKWFEAIDCARFDDYLARRPSKLRNTYKRKNRALEKSGRGRFRLFTTPGDIEPAIAAYEEIYRQSWKEPEPYPDFTPALIRDCAARGCLRLGVLFIDDTPAAAQIWIVSDGCATIYKLSYSESFKSFSAGTILTMEMARHVIETDHVHEIDFGRGDDPYKSDWLASRREYWGLIAYNPSTMRGVLAAARYLGARAVKALMNRKN